MKKNIVDDFLSEYERQSEDLSKYKKIKKYYKPTKFKCIINFLFGLILMFIIIRMYFGFYPGFFIMFFTDTAYLLYFGLNLFTKKGLPLPRYEYIRIQENPEEEEEENDEYRN